MAFILKLMWYNDLIVPATALLCNLLLLFLLFTVNRSFMKQILYALVPNCIIDIFLSIATAANAMQVFVINAHAYLVIGSPLRYLGFRMASILTIFFGSTVITSSAAICVPFYFRYLVVCKKQDIGMKHIIKSYSLVFIIFASLVTEYYSKELEEIWQSEHENERPTYVANKIDSVIFLSLYGYIAVISITSYSFVIYFSRSISKELQNHASFFTETKILHNQLNKTLIYQAIGPFLTSNVPVLLIIAMFFLKIEKYEINFFLSILLGWIPISNPIVAILIIKPYRRKVKEMLGFICRLNCWKWR